MPGKFRLRSGRAQNYPASNVRHRNLRVIEVVIVPPLRLGITPFRVILYIVFLIWYRLPVPSTKDYSTGTHCLLDPSLFLFDGLNLFDLLAEFQATIPDQNPICRLFPVRFDIFPEKRG